MRIQRLFAVPLLLWAAACASTQVTGSWKNPTAADFKPQKVLVVGRVPGGNRTQLETEVASKLGAAGLTAVPSEKLFPPGQTLDKDQVEQLVKANGFDSVLVTSFRGVQQEASFTPDMGYGGYIGGYDYPAGDVWGAGTMEVSDNVLMETNLFDARGQGEKVWSASTSTFEPANISKQIPGFAEVLVKKMTKDGMT